VSNKSPHISQGTLEGLFLLVVFVVVVVVDASGATIYNN